MLKLSYASRRETLWPLTKLWPPFPPGSCGLAVKGVVKAFGTETRDYTDKPRTLRAVRIAEAQTVCWDCGSCFRRLLSF